MARRAFLPVLAVVALLAAVLGLNAATPAAATTKPIGLSLDGITYADALPASLFAGALIVPGSTVMRSFYVQNRAPEPGNLAVALQDVVGVDSVMISALSVKAVTPSTSRPWVPFPMANPCHSLTSGVTLAPGATVRVDVTLKFGASPTGRNAQHSVGSFDLGVMLTSTDVSAPNGCAAVTPPTGGTSGTGGTGGGGHSTTPRGELDTAVVSGAADGSLPVDHNDGDHSGSGDGYGDQIIQPNTARFFQEYDIVGWLALMMLGGIFAGWRRSRDPEDEQA